MHKNIDPTGYGIEEWKSTFLAYNYEWFFAPLVGKEIKLLELGVASGLSLRFWRDYFENATIVGLDCGGVDIKDTTGMIRVYRGYQQDIELLDRIGQEQAPDGFDVVIDDCSHIGSLARISFWHLFQNHLKPGGFYCIEDWGTGYYPWCGFVDSKSYKPKSRLTYPWKERFVDTLSAALFRVFPNGINLFGAHPLFAMTPRRLFIRSAIPSHMHGMVGFVKELLDACFWRELGIPRSGSGRYLHYGIERIYVNAGVIVVEKALFPSQGK